VQQAELTAAGVRWVGTLQPEEKLPEIMHSGITPDWCRNESGLAEFSIGIYRHISLEDAARWLVDEYGAVILGRARLRNAVSVALPAENWADLAADERVLWVEPYWPRRPHNNSNRVNANVDIVQAPPYDLDGSDIVVGEWDEGQVDGSHPDFDTRVTNADGAAVSSHSTHVAGTVMGSGASSSGTYRGMAPGAELVSHEWWDFSWELESDTESDINLYDLDISTNSWGVALFPINVPNCNGFLGNYYSECATLDDICRGDLGKPITIVWSAGNDRLVHPDYCGSVGFTWGTIGPYATAKNLIAVGGINSNNSTMTDFSAWGPTDDGRLKPELVAPGCQTTGDHGVTSTLPGTGYGTYCGTSQAAPTVAGCVALWLERYEVLNPGQTPLASTVKAVFVETADDLGATGPEYDFGYGRLNTEAAVDRLNDGALLESSINDQETASWEFFHDGSLTEMSFTLAWDDPGALAGANPTLVNDLDLLLSAPDGETPATYLPWVLNPADPSASATEGVDHINNLEQVRPTGTLPVGIWTVTVTGYSIPTGPQAFSIAYSSGISLSAGPLDYAVSVEADADTAAIPGDLPISFLITNEGQQNDTYDVALTSVRGWSITPNPTVVSINSQDSAPLGFTLEIPLSALPGDTDTISAVAVSQGDPGVSVADDMIVTALSGRDVSVLLDLDTVGIQGKEIEFAFTVSNTGLVPDDIAWAVTNDDGWLIVPAGGTVSTGPVEDIVVPTTLTIPDPETIGLEAAIDLTTVSLADPEAYDSDTGHVSVIDYPPQPVLSSPGNGSVIGTGTPDLEWTRLPHVPYPPGLDVFAYAVEIAADELFTIDLIRYTGISEMVFTVPVSLNDGQHYWRVWTHNLFGDSSVHSVPFAFETDTQAPDAPILLAPGDGAYEADTTPVFSWTEVTAKSSATPISYLWEASADPSFAADVDSVWTSLTTHTIPDGSGLAPCSTVVFWRVTARDDAGNQSAPSSAREYRVYLPGDVAFDCMYDVFDVVQLIDHVFRDGALPDPPGRAETNCQPPVDIFDVVVLVNHVFRSGPPPCGPP
jgi:hypothetical protein